LPGLLSKTLKACCYRLLTIVLQILKGRKHVAGELGGLSESSGHVSVDLVLVAVSVLV
jgi:hypothetical protein